MRLNKKITLWVVSFLLIIEVFFVVFWVSNRNELLTVPSSAETIIKNCDKVADFVKCVDSAILELEQKLSYTEIANLINAFSLRDPRLNDCHELAHRVSESYGQRGAIPVSENNLLDPYSCGGGFLHGIITNQLSENQAIDGAMGAKVCNQYSGQYQQINCVHMLGHISYYMLADISKTVNYCNHLKESLLITHCFSGIFMEYTLSTVARSHDSTLPLLRVNKELINSYEKICLSLQGPARDSCYTEAARLYLSYYRMNPDKVFGACKSAQPDSSGQACQRYAALLIASNDLTVTGSKVCDNRTLSIERGKCRDTVGFGIVSNSFINILRIPDVCDNEAIVSDQCVKKIVKRIYSAYGVRESLIRCTQLKHNEAMKCLEILTRV